MNASCGGSTVTSAVFVCYFRSGYLQSGLVIELDTNCTSQFTLSVTIRGSSKGDKTA